MPETKDNPRAPAPADRAATDPPRARDTQAPVAGPGGPPVPVRGRQV
jgi:hypothetical protein